MWAGSASTSKQDAQIGILPSCNPRSRFLFGEEGKATFGNLPTKEGKATFATNKKATFASLRLLLGFVARSLARCSPAAYRSWSSRAAPPCSVAGREGPGLCRGDWSG